MRVVMALKVRNESDIIDVNLRHHLSHGVDFFVVTDNDSDDGTREILQRYADAGLMEVIDEPHEDFWSRAHAWVTRMARLAAERHGADWVLHADADEFWMPVAGSLKQGLERVPERYQVVLAPRPEFVPRPPGDEPFYERMTVRERYSRLRPKVAHRALPGVELHQGAHDVALSEQAAASILRDSRAVTRFPGAAGVADDGSLAWAPYWPARVLHFPIRSYEQYRARVETIVFRGDPPVSETRKRLRRRYNNDRLDRSYAKLVAAEPEIERGIEAGRLVVDERLRDALRDSPDPFAPRSAEVADSESAEPAAGQAELAEIEYDAMQAIARNQRLLVRRLDRLQRQSGKRKARLNPRPGTLPGRMLLRLRRSL
ncbi:MAG: glycosyltransferase family 2 protein [Solirubrobacterales bacterium]|nr:MAG: glycosyltransferase family 2 protein [Solirubrobacterales bacterium]